MLQRSSPFLPACVVTLAALIAAPSATRAEAIAGKAQSASLDQTTVKTVIDSIAVELREAYVFPDKGAQAADALETALKSNAYAGLTDPTQLALQLTAQLRAITKDSHMRVISGSPFRNQPPPAAPQDAGFAVKRLDGNIGYIHLARFVPPDIFNPAADDAMRQISDTAALIIDMRDNGGGHPASVAYLVSFFLDPGHRVHINDLIWRNRGTSTFRTESFWSSPTPVRYLGKPVYVLVGSKTYSAGEEFAYDMHVLERATVVGETTRGGANPGGLNKVGADLFVVVPTGRAENPITHGNWGGVGVQPDVSAPLEQAQQTALDLALRRKS
ncbi:MULTISPECIES: S41 family peptidase [Rhodopseudomonas]|uniref:Peptidase S41 n=1 Tax=Rhodopseudomonas palustris TaxID=1076 RepID=A0A0D7E0H5_RHOPL|nr:MULTISPECIES: S41 family peptidase [Rhodopseudomonas]KIZ34011.1 peptidase S41 [Rhodopseudomonas palustris]MDF3810274.1 S41 family peptidase [Rhodopseudomonas sp. BAL398]WOK17134.1 S41 family peptidase [Rhodopseudomonas sp. BAL398]